MGPPPLAEEQQGFRGGGGGFEAFGSEFVIHVQDAFLRCGLALCHSKRPRELF